VQELFTTCDERLRRCADVIHPSPDEMLSALANAAGNLSDFVWLVMEGVKVSCPAESSDTGYIRVYRGCWAKYATVELLQQNEREIAVFPSLTSTSLNRSIAVRFPASLAKSKTSVEILYDISAISHRMVFPVGNSAFCGCRRLTIPPSVTSVGNSAFCG
jgi:hypothetical protein